MKDLSADVTQSVFPVSHLTAPLLKRTELLGPCVHSPTTTHTFVHSYSFADQTGRCLCVYRQSLECEHDYERAVSQMSALISDMWYKCTARSTVSSGAQVAAE